MKPGVYQIDNQEYHAADGLNTSALKELAKSPAHYRAWLAENRQPTAAMIFGTAFHTSILEPDKFIETVSVPPADVLGKNDSRNTKAYREWESTQPTGLIISPSELEAINGMRASVMGHKTARGLLMSEGPVEQSIFWEDFQGILCKVRPDKQAPGLGTIIDLKSCEDASPSGFSRACANFEYHIQAAFYLAGANTVASGCYYENFVFIAVEKKPPYAVAVYRADDQFIERGRGKVKDLTTLYLECSKTGIWPDYEDRILDISLPKWAE